MSVATLNSTTCIRARIQLPSWGVWWADVELAGEVEISGSATLKIADAEFVGTIKAGGIVNGRSVYRIAAGAGAWGNSIAARAYSNDLGVKRTTIAADAASAAGETVDTSGLSGTIGPAFIRPAGVASAALDQIAPQSWYADADGTTRFGSRTATTISTSAPRVRVDPSAGLIVLATNEIAGLVPGAIVDSVTAVDVRHELSPDDGLRTTLWGSAWGASRRSEALRRLIRSLIPELKWSGVYEYRIGLLENERLALQPVLTSLGLPDLRRVKVRPSLAGSKCEHTLGSLCLVAFVNSDPSRPVVVAFDDAESSGFVPTKVEIGGTPRFGVARLGDMAGPYVITSASSRVEVE